jgi:hypothetical protein
MPDTDTHDELAVVAEVPEPAAQRVFDTLYEADLSPVYLPSPDIDLIRHPNFTPTVPIAVPRELADRAREVLRYDNAKRRPRQRHLGDMVRRQLLASGIIAAVGAGILRLLAGSWSKVSPVHVIVLALGALAATSFVFHVGQFVQDSPDEDI